MTVHFVRHAQAGHREDWPGDDQLRPLSLRGRIQTALLTERLAGAAIGRIVTSPYVRCVQTVEPLGERLGLDVEADDVLAEERPLEPVLELVRSLSGVEAVLCSHGDVLLGVLEALAAKGVELIDRGRPLGPGDPVRLGKGSTWVFHLDGDDVVQAVYLPPPDRS